LRATGARRDFFAAGRAENAAYVERASVATSLRRSEAMLAFCCTNRLACRRATLPNSRRAPSSTESNCAGSRAVCTADALRRCARVRSVAEVSSNFSFNFMGSPVLRRSIDAAHHSGATLRVNRGDE
jgi:hypothetical protein